ncbi:hypothetical protein BDP27DRAFT_848537 [Rhodocollybia butyracea]|uniref:Uncharacterized protein n=1 Tax=Rhodocollybia butyracea TaxID=206335 RepID=A0A9P5U6K0_9AGAR|nr:hypothetical protein BDP27DRAFT_848537 [Rhodocollybia butyracea]
MGFHIGGPSLRVDKDLPPTPETSSGHGTPPRQPSRKNSEDLLPTLFPVQDPGRLSFENSPRPSSASALAQATLGLSLPHVLPHASAPPSSAESNSVAFASSPSSEIITPRRDAETHMKHRAVSAAGLSTLSDIENDKRTRRPSLGPSGLFGFSTADVKGKGKEKQLEKESSDIAPSKLSRRASFWSRKKVPSSDSLLPARKSEINLVPLPALPPFSPFNVDMMKSSLPDPASQSLRPHHSRGLSRSHSERARRASLKASQSHSNLLPPDSPKLEQFRRPNTAGAQPFRPQLSQFVSAGSSERFTSPLASPTVEFSPVAIEAPPPPKRRRAQTNPPLLRRLSMNLFSSSSSPSSNHPAPPTPVLPGTSSPLRTSTSKPTPTSVPKPQQDEESPEVYLSRLMVSVSKAEIGGILASR